MAFLYSACVLRRWSRAVGAGVLLSALLAGPVAQAQAPANDDPCGAVVLAPQGQFCTAPVLSTNQGATTTAPNGYANTGSCGGLSSANAPKDVWFKFTTAATGLASTGATLAVSGNQAGQVRLFSAPGCAGPFTELRCVAAPNSNVTAPPLAYFGLTPTTTYFVQVMGYQGTDPTGPFTICLTDGPGFVPCGTAVFGRPVYTTPGNTAATVAFTPPANSAGPYTATLETLLSSYYPPVSPRVFAVAPPSIALTGLVPGGGYTLRIQGTCVTGGPVYGTTNFTVPAPNDEPCGALALPLDVGTGCTPLAGAAMGATTTPPNGYANPGCGGVAAATDVWYTVTTAASGPGSTSLVLTLNNTTDAAQLRLFAAPSCAGPFAELACSAPTATSLSAAPLVATGLVPNTTFFVCVSGTPPSIPNSFTLCASALPPALACAALERLQLPVFAPVAPTANVTLVPAYGSAPPLSYTVTYTPAGGAPLVLTVPYAASSLPVALTGLLPGTAYTVTVVANCPGGAQSAPVSGTFTTAPAGTPPPANDDCFNAQPLAVAPACVPTTATTLYATPSVANVVLCNALNSRPPDVWFRAVVPANGIVQVNIGAAPGSAVTSVIAQLLTGACGTLTPVDCTTASLPGGGRVRGTGLVPGSTVYARVAGAVGGEFTVCATTDVTCPLVTNLAVSALTPTAATLAFSLPAGGSYVLVYTPAGGASQTQVLTASPVQLSGLLPNTAYAVAITGTCPGAPAGTVRTAFTTPPVPACAAPAAVYAGNVGPTTAGVGFVLNPDATGYVLTYQAAGGPVQTLAPAPTASPVALTGLVPGTNYTVCVASTCPNGLTAPAACTTVFRTLLAARNAAGAAQIGLFPNPARRSVTLVLPAAVLAQATGLVLCDALGRPVRHHLVGATRTEWDLNGLPAGVYVLHVLGSSGSLAKRLVIE
jgi:hypothetical protein